MSELDYLYRYDPQKRAYVSRGNLGEETTAVSENRPSLVFLQSENDSATGQFFPVGQGIIKTTNLHFHWQKVPVPGHHGEKVSESEFYTHTPGNSKYLVNYHVVPLGDTGPPPGLRATENRAFEANIKQNHPDFSFYTSEHNDGHERTFCPNGEYSPGSVHPPTGKELWRKWKFEYTGNARIPCWVVRVPKDIIWGHGGLWSDNSIAMFGAHAVVATLRPPYELREIIRHAYQFGYRSAPLIITAGIAVGVVLSMHTRASLERFGAEAMIPAALAIALIRETGPLITGLLVAGRVGAGIGAEIGAMKVTEQIDALEANAVDAFKYLAVTRIVALMIAMPLLTIMMDFAGILGGYVAEAAASGMSWRLYFERAFNYITYSDLILATLKTVVFGYLIAVVSSYLGFTTSRGTEGVGEASTRSVVMASVLIILSDVILVKLIFFFYPVVSG